MNNYTYYDYEDAYCKQQIELCKEIGLKLLSELKDKDSKKLFNELKELKWEWNLPQEEQTKIYELLSKIKIWLMVYKEN